MRIRTAGMVSILALSLAMAGCGGKSAESSAKTPQSQLTIWADDKRAAVLKPFADKFGAENGVTVKVQAISKDQETAFVTASQQGSGPDVTVGAHDWIGNLVQNGAIDPVQLSEQQKSGLAANALKAVTFNGQVYGIPYATENLALIRNTDLAPKAPATIEDLVADAKKIKTQEILCLQVGQTGDAYHHLHRQEVRLPDLRPVGDHRREKGRHQVRHHAGPRLRGRQAGHAVPRRADLLRRRQG